MTNIVLLSFQLFTNSAGWSTGVSVSGTNSDRWIMIDGPKSVVAEYRIGYRLPETNIEIQALYQRIGTIHSSVTPSNTVTTTFVPEAKDSR